MLHDLNQSVHGNVHKYSGTRDIMIIFPIPKLEMNYLEETEVRSFSWTEHRNSFHDEIYKSVVDETKNLGCGVIESCTIRDIYHKFLNDSINPFPDGQRSLVFTPTWAMSLISTMLETVAPIDTMTINHVNNLWYIIKGKQRLSSLFCFFIGLIHVTVQDKKFIWTTATSTSTGSNELYSKANQSTGVLGDWKAEIEQQLSDFGYDINDEKENCQTLPEDVREAFLNRVVHFIVLPSWTSRAASLYTVWTEMKSFKHSSSECVYSIPRLNVLKRHEPLFASRGKCFHLENDKHQVFTHVIRALLYKLKVKYIPFAKNVYEYDVIMGELNRIFVVNVFTDTAVIDSLVRAARTLEDVRDNVRDYKNKRKPITKICPDMFTCFLVIASNSKNRATISTMLNRAVKVFKCTKKERNKELGDHKLRIWDEGFKFGNFVNVLQVLE